MKKVRGTVFGIVGGALGLALGALLIAASRDKNTTLNGRPGLTLGLWFIAGGGLAVIVAIIGRRQATIRGSACWPASSSAASASCRRALGDPQRPRAAVVADRRHTDDGRRDPGPAQRR